jgi:hypothetical protein
MSTVTYVIYYGFTVFKIDYLYCSKVRQKQTDLYRCDNRGRRTVFSHHNPDSPIPLQT